MMVPAAFVGQTVQQLTKLMTLDDRIIDGDNSYYQDNPGPSLLPSMKRFPVHVLSAALYQ
jgi:6-phosphogluconate dehydrogenase (decarboxylating)